jgi:hypothetical protein
MTRSRSGLSRAPDDLIKDGIRTGLEKYALRQPQNHPLPDIELVLTFLDLSEVRILAQVLDGVVGRKAAALRHEFLAILETDNSDASE